MNPQDCSLEKFLESKITGRVSQLPIDVLGEFGVESHQLPDTEIINIESEIPLPEGELASFIVFYYVCCGYDINIKQLTRPKTPNDGKLKDLLYQTKIPEPMRHLPYCHLLETTGHHETFLVVIAHDDHIASINKYPGHAYG